MQTFLPYSSFKDSAAVLDNRRLGKQRVENLQIMQVLLEHKLVTQEIVETGRTYPAFIDIDGVEIDPEEIQPGQHIEIIIMRERKLVDMAADRWYVVPKESASWSNHPAVAMWRGYEWALLRYQMAICHEWKSRGLEDTCRDKTISLFQMIHPGLVEATENPPWVGDIQVHRSHQSNLVRKDPEHYGKFFPEFPDNLPYFWPTIIEGAAPHGNEEAEAR